MHYTRFIRHGDPLYRVKDADRRTRVPGYSTIHNRVRLEKGQAFHYLCVDCGEQAKDWSYDKQDPEELYDRDGTPYSGKIEHYVARCRACHTRFDRETSVPELRRASGRSNESPWLPGMFPVF